MYELFATNKFKRDIKKRKRQNKKMPKLHVILELLITGETLPANNRDHNLTGNYASHSECHIEPDWLLIYRVNEEEQQIRCPSPANNLLTLQWANVRSKFR